MLNVEEFIESLSDEQREFLVAVDILHRLSISDEPKDMISICRIRAEWDAIAYIVNNKLAEVVTDDGQLRITFMGEALRSTLSRFIVFGE